MRVESGDHLLEHLNVIDEIFGLTIICEPDFVPGLSLVQQTQLMPPIDNLFYHATLLDFSLIPETVMYVKLVFNSYPHTDHNKIMELIVANLTRFLVLMSERDIIQAQLKSTQFLRESLDLMRGENHARDY